MRIILLRKNPEVYSGNAWLILGDSNTLLGVNALVDIGLDAFILDHLQQIFTGIGKKPLQTVFLTHSHYDHAGGLEEVMRALSPEIYAMAPLLGVTRLLRDGERVSLGDRRFEVLHTPGHSEDSMCLYCPEDRVLFSGDTPVQVRTTGGAYPRALTVSLERLCALPVQTIYPGHGDPITRGAAETLRETLQNVRRSDLEP
jgi:glyoxylase-like metal-dependent hydrolase (beta-lactamase superfamily II)